MPVKLRVHGWVRMWVRMRLRIRVRVVLAYGYRSGFGLG